LYRPLRPLGAPILGAAPLITNGAPLLVDAGTPIISACPQCSKLVSGSCVACVEGEKHPSCIDCKDGKAPVEVTPWYQTETFRLIFTTVAASVLTAVILHQMNKRAR
jgi:hypothetical protein